MNTQPIQFFRNRLSIALFRPYLISIGLTTITIVTVILLLAAIKSIDRTAMLETLTVACVLCIGLNLLIAYGNWRDDIKEADEKNYALAWILNNDLTATIGNNSDALQLTLKSTIKHDVTVFGTKYVATLKERSISLDYEEAKALETYLDAFPEKKALLTEKLRAATMPDQLSTTDPLKALLP